MKDESQDFLGPSRSLVKIKTRYFDSYLMVLWTIFFILTFLIFRIGLDGILDARLYYTFEEATQYLKSLTPEQVVQYLQITKLDLFFIFIYSAILVLSLKKVMSQNIHWLGTLPGCFDVIETLNIMFYLQNKVSPGVFEWLGYLTALKWIGVSALTTLFIILYSHQMRSSGIQS